MPQVNTTGPSRWIARNTCHLRIGWRAPVILNGRTTFGSDRTRFVICGAKLQVSDSPFCRFPSNRPGPDSRIGGPRCGGSMRRTSIAVLSISISLMMSSRASADFRDGNDLLRDCTSPSQLNYCGGYITAIASVMGGGNGVNGFAACIPSGIEAGQIKDIVIGFLQRHPERRHVGAAGLVAHAIADAFPCR
jgi:hypothetical protein